MLAVAVVVTATVLVRGVAELRGGVTLLVPLRPSTFPCVLVPTIDPGDVTNGVIPMGVVVAATVGHPVMDLAFVLVILRAVHIGSVSPGPVATAHIRDSDTRTADHDDECDERRRQAQPLTTDGFP